MLIWFVSTDYFVHDGYLLPWCSCMSSRKKTLTQIISISVAPQGTKKSVLRSTSVEDWLLI